MDFENPPWIFKILDGELFSTARNYFSPREALHLCIYGHFAAPAAPAEEPSIMNPSIKGEGLRPPPFVEGSIMDGSFMDGSSAGAAGAAKCPYIHKCSASRGEK